MPSETQETEILELFLFPDFFFSYENPVSIERDFKNNCVFLIAESPLNVTYTRDTIATIRNMCFDLAGYLPYLSPNSNVAIAPPMNQIANAIITTVLDECTGVIAPMRAIRPRPD
jgi:hypothetical protein